MSVHRRCSLLTAASLAVAVSPAFAGPPIASRLRCEYAENPLGIGDAQPRLSWVLDSDRRGEAQTAYQILASSSEAALAADKGDLWNTGKVDSDRSSQIAYAGRPLASAERAWWKVRVWDCDGAPSAWSAPAWWEMGLLKKEDWSAKWIGFTGEKAEAAAPKLTLDGVRWVWAPEGDPEKSAPAGERYFRRRFDLPDRGLPRSATVLVTADDSFVLFANGKEVGRGAGFNRLFTFDIRERLKPGPNVLAVGAVNGGGPAGAIARLRVEWDAGDPLEVATDRQWKAGSGKAGKWMAAGFDDADWPAAKELSVFGQGPWQGFEFAAGPAAIGPCPFFRKAFTLSKPVRRARAYATALGLYELHLNGHRVGEDLLTPGWTDYTKRVQVQAYDVTALLRPGENAVGLILADGWYSGFLGWGGKRGYYGPHPYALAQVRVEYEDGSVETIGTDAAWKASFGPLFESDLLWGETYDARKELAGWDAPAFDDKGWQAPAVKDAFPIALDAQRGPTVRKTEELPAKSVNEPVAGTYVFDLGQNLVGWARLRVTGPAGTRVRLRFAEMLNPDKTIYVTNLRSARATDTYILKGGGGEVYEPRFTTHGFRYVEVTGYPGAPPLDAVTGIVVHSATPPSGTFECSDAMVNQLWRNIVWGQRGNFVSVPTDCPQRDERLGWMGDAQIFVRTATYNMDVAGFFTKWMVDVEDAQSSEGAFSDVSPRMPHVSDGSPAWGDAGLIVPWTIHRVYGDTRILGRHYAAMAKWIEYIRSANPNLLWTKRVNNNYGDWVSIPENATPKEVLSTAFFANSARIMAGAARALGKDDDARKYDDLFKAIREAFNKAFVAADGRIKGDTQTCYALALRFDLLPEEKREAAGRHLMEQVEKHGGVLTTGFLGVFHLLPALTDAGHLDAAYALLTSHKFPSWGYSIDRGATTIWERWDGWTVEKGFQDPGMNSFNHYSFGSVGTWMFNTVAGVELDPEVTGFKRIVLRPRPGGGITHAQAAYDSIHGRIESAWRIGDGKFRLRTVVPPNTTALVFMPAKAEGDVTEGGKPAGQAEGVKFLKMSGGAAVFAVGSGTYEWESPQ